MTSKSNRGFLKRGHLGARRTWCGISMVPSDPSVCMLPWREGWYIMVGGGVVSVATDTMPYNRVRTLCWEHWDPAGLCDGNCRKAVI